MPGTGRGNPGSSPSSLRAFATLLRAVNLGGSTQVAMQTTRRILERLGFEDVRSLLQSGNLVFFAADSGTPTLERRIEAAIERETGKSVEVFVRSSVDWRSVLSTNPFHTEAETDPARLQVAFLKQAPAADAWKALDRAIVGPERVSGAGRHAYLFYPDGVGHSKLTTARIERSLGTRVTLRNWNTVRKIGAALGI